MKVALLIAVMLASATLVDSFRRRRRRIVGKRDVTFQEKEQALQDAVAKLEEVVHDAESKSAMELMREFMEEEGPNGALNGDTFEKKTVNEVEEDAALGLLEEELEELEEELEEVKDDPDE